MSETEYEYEDGLLVRSVTTTEPDWTEADRGLLLALLAEQAEICPQCGHLKADCRDPNSRYEVVEDQCQASRVAQAVAENNAKSSAPRRGVVIGTRRTN